MPCHVQNGANWTTTIDYSKVTRVGEVGVIDYGGAPYLMFEIDVEVCW